MASTASFLESYVESIADEMVDSSIAEIAINPDGKVWVERQGATHMTLLDGKVFKPDHANNLGTAIASEVGAAFSQQKPVFSGKIEYQNRPLRAQVMASPVVEGGPAITLRSYSQNKIALSEAVLIHGSLIDLDSQRLERGKKVAELAQEGKVSEAMKMCVDDRLNVVISGGTSTGKTTFARGLLDLVNPAERMVTIEDAFELFPEQPNSVCLKAKRTDDGEMTPAKLLEGTLRMRPDRIILGELRGNESKTFLDAINTGHGGSFTTIHADTARKAIDRLALMVMSVGINMSFQEVRRYCASSIDIVVQLGRHEGRRGVAEMYLPSVYEEDLNGS